MQLTAKFGQTSLIENSGEKPQRNGNMLASLPKEVHTYQTLDPTLNKEAENPEDNFVDPKSSVGSESRLTTVRGTTNFAKKFKRAS